MVSINTNTAALFAQTNIAAANDASSSSVARLSSGNRIVKASDDVAALAIGTSLTTQVSALKTALTNASQGTSLLQVADGALAQINNILQQQQSLALQASSGALTNTDRGFLNQQFQALSDQINSLATGTTFNGVKLLDGSLSRSANVAASNTQATGSTINVSLNTNGSVGNTFIVNGVTFTAIANSGTPANAQEFRLGLDAAGTIANLAQAITAAAQTTDLADNLGQATYSATGTSLTITSVTGGLLSRNFTVSAASTLLSSDKGTVSGGFGGTVLNMFRGSAASAFFSSATTSVTSATTATAAAPFVVGNTITATIGSGSAVNLYTLKSGDTLTTIVNGINANSGTSGVKAALIYDPTYQRYNIQLSTAASSGGIAINGGAGFYNDIDDQTYFLNTARATQSLFTSDFAAQLNTTNLVGTDSTQPFTTGSSLNVVKADGTLANITGALTGTVSLENLRDLINADPDAKALGIQAAISGSNLNITYNDSTQSRSLGFVVTGANFNGISSAAGQANRYGSLQTTGLNSAQQQINLFETGFDSIATVISAATATQTTPFQSGNSLSITIDSESALSIATLTAGLNLQGLAGLINQDNDAIRRGITAQVVQQDDGKYNIRLNIATTVASSTISVNGGANFFDAQILDNGGTYTTAAGNITSPTAASTSPTASTDGVYYNLFTDEQAAALGTSDVVAAATRTFSQPFANGDRLFATVGTDLTNEIDLTGSLAGTESLSDLATLITTNGTASGITASVTADGKNIRIRYDGTATGAAASSTNPNLKFAIGTAGTYTFATNTGLLPAAVDNAGVSATGSLNNSYSYRDLFSSYISASQTVTAANPDGTATYFQTGVAATIAGVTSVATNIFDTATNLASVVTAINSDTTFRANNIRAQLLTDGLGQVNIRIVVVDDLGTGPASTIAFTQADAQAADGASSPAPTATSAVTYINNILQGNTNLVAATTTDNTATRLTTYGAAGGADNGLGLGSTSVSGTVGNNLITALSGSVARYSIGFPDVAEGTLDSTNAFKSDGTVFITVGGKNFTFTNTSAASKAPDEITIGNTLQETLDNAVATINNYAKNVAQGEVAYSLNQLKITRVANSLVFEGKALTNPVKSTGAALDAIALSNFGGTTTATGSTTLANAGTTFGVDVTGISNEKFAGTISGFTATYTGTANTVNLSVKVGDYTYTALNVSTNPSSDTRIRLVSDTVGGKNGGYFDIQLANGAGQSVTQQSGSNSANEIATRLNTAFSTLDFSQKRVISSYSDNQTIVAGGAVVGSLVGSSVSAQLSSFDGVKVTGINVSAVSSVTGDASITINLGTETFTTTSGLGTQLGANQTYRLVSTSNPLNFIEFTTGNSSINLSTAANAQAAEDALAKAFGSVDGAGALSFQIGASSSDTIGVSLGSAQTSTLFGGEDLNISTQQGATDAAAVITDAINAITALRANVGALQTQFNFASAALQTSVQNQDSARSLLLDTDIAAESTSFATSQVKLQAGISVLAQANQQLQALLKLIG